MFHEGMKQSRTFQPSARRLPILPSRSTLSIPAISLTLTPGCPSPPPTPTTHTPVVEPGGVPGFVLLLSRAPLWQPNTGDPHFILPRLSETSLSPWSLLPAVCLVDDETGSRGPPLQVREKQQRALDWRLLRFRDLPVPSLCNWETHCILSFPFLISRM